MAKEAIHRQNHTPIQRMTYDEGAYVSLSTPEGIKEAGKALQSYGVIANPGNGFEKTVAFRRQDFSNLSPNTSSMPGLTRGDWEFFRPDETIPNYHRDIMQVCNDAYLYNGVVRNIIDLMADFAVQGIRLSHPHKRTERFYRNWWEKVKGKHVSERFMNNIYRLGNVVIRKQTAKNTKSLKETLYKTGAGADLEIDVSNPKTIELPWRYTFLHPGAITVVGGQLASFVGKPIYAINLPASLRRAIQFTTSDVQAKLVALLPPDIVAAAQQNVPYPLEPDKTLVFHYKKDDWQPWAYPIVFSALKDINIYDKLKLADAAALDGAISNLRIFKLGSLEYQIAPTNAAVSKLASILTNNVGAGVVNLIWGPDIELVESKTEVHKFLGEEKYKPTLTAIYNTFGIPPTLTAGGGDGATNNFMSLKTLLERLSNGRGILDAFWGPELKQVAKEMGFPTPALIEYDMPSLGTEEAEKALLIKLSEQKLISDEALQHRFGQNPDMERIRINRENKDKQTGRRVPTPGPYDSPQNNEAALKKIALQTGVSTPSEVGLELEENKNDEKPAMNVKHEQTMEQTKFQAEKQHELAKVKLQEQKQKGVPGQGRPVGKVDTTKRKRRTFSPRGTAYIELWARSAQDKIADVLTPGLLNYFQKKNWRSLNVSQEQYAEKMIGGVLFNIEPLTEITQDVVTAALSKEIEPIFEHELDNFKNEFIKNIGIAPTKDDVKCLRAQIYINLKGL